MSKKDNEQRPVATPEDEAAIKKLEEAEARALADAAVAAAQLEAAKDSPPPSPQTSGVPPRGVITATRDGADQVVEGDVTVICLRDQATTFMANRLYCLKKGARIQMHPGHATELAQTGWVLVVAEAPPAPPVAATE